MHKNALMMVMLILAVGVSVVYYIKTQPIQEIPKNNWNQSQEKQNWNQPNRLPIQTPPIQPGPYRPNPNQPPTPPWLN